MLRSNISKTPTYGGFTLKKSSIVNQLDFNDPSGFYRAVNDTKIIATRNNYYGHTFNLIDGKYIKTVE